MNSNILNSLIKLIKDAALFGVRSNPNIQENAFNSQLANFEASKIELLENCKNEINEEALSHSALIDKIDEIEQLLKLFQSNDYGAIDKYDVKSGILQLKALVNQCTHFEYRLTTLHTELENLKREISHAKRIT